MSAAFTGADGKPQIPGRGDGKRYPARGERSVLNGKPVVADGKGNWLDASNPMTPMSERGSVGNYSPGLRFPSVKAIQSGEYGSRGSGGQNPAAPPQAAKPRGQNLPPSAAVPGTGPEGNTVGSDADPNTPGLQGPGAPGARVNANGLVSYGRDLSSLNAFTSAFTGGYELSDIKTAFKSNDLEGAYQTGSNTIADTGDKYELPDSQTPLTGGNSYEGAEGLKIDETSYTIPEASVPGTIGRANTAQDGSSGKPDVADQIRQVRMQRKGPRDDGGPRGFRIDRENEMAQNSVSETKGNGMNEKRRAIRSAFLDLDTPIIQASVKANAIAGYGKDSNGNARFNYGGELVYAKEGMEQKAKNAAMMGKDPTAYLAIPTTPETLPDSPAPSELSPSFAKETPGAQEFFKSELKKVKDKNK